MHRLPRGKSTGRPPAKEGENKVAFNHRLTPATKQKFMARVKFLKATDPHYGPLSVAEILEEIILAWLSEHIPPVK